QGRTIFDGQVIVTAGQRDSVMVYKGAKASMMVCSRVCTTADDEATTAGQGSAAPAMVMSSAPTPSAPAAPGAAVALQQ
ncbi:MAG: pilus assembly protein N-terminal domain-containing protein, partial [Asticcacaulis sp.]